MSTNRLFRRAVVISAAAGLTGLAGAGIASAHVTANVYGDQPEKGGYGAIVLRVPNEEEDAGTTKLEVTFPEGSNISSARTKPVAGWTADVSKRGDAVTKITWTARPGNEIAAGSTSYEEFPFVAGPMPENMDTLVLAAAQTYSDGTVVNWNQQAEGDEEPEHPAPVVELAAASGEGHGAAAHTSGESAESGGDAHAQESAGDNTARWLGGAGLAVGALGLGVGVGATVRARKRTSA